MGIGVSSLLTQAAAGLAVKFLAMPWLSCLACGFKPSPGLGPASLGKRYGV